VNNEFSPDFVSTYNSTKQSKQMKYYYHKTSSKSTPQRSMSDLSPAEADTVLQCFRANLAAIVLTTSIGVSSANTSLQSNRHCQGRESGFGRLRFDLPRMPCDEHQNIRLCRLKHCSTYMRRLRMRLHCQNSTTDQGCPAWQTSLRYF
jgi:hypothetical protein